MFIQAATPDLQFCDKAKAMIVSNKNDNDALEDVYGGVIVVDWSVPRVHSDNCLYTVGRGIMIVHVRL